MNTWGNKILNQNVISWLLEWPFKRLKKTAYESSADKRETSTDGHIICDLQQPLWKDSMEAPPAPRYLVYHNFAIHFLHNFVEYILCAFEMELFSLF